MGDIQPVRETVSPGRPKGLERCWNEIRPLLPGVLLAIGVAIVAVSGTNMLSGYIPVMLMSLIVGIVVNPFVARPREVYAPGFMFCIKRLLRWTVALLGFRISLNEIAALGMQAAALVMLSMAITIVSGFVMARVFKLPPGFGALAGAGTAVCGASATLATSTVVPAYEGKERDIVFVVVGINALSTVAMVLYPAICAMLGFDQTQTGVMLGATIHDVAQVVGAGYAVSEPVGNVAVIVKLFRVFLLLPVVLLIGYWLFHAGAKTIGQVRSTGPVPLFALFFLIFCVVNTLLLRTLEVAPFYLATKHMIEVVSNWGLLIAISALGLATGINEFPKLGWRHLATITTTTFVILVVVSAELWLQSLH